MKLKNKIKLTRFTNNNIKIIDNNKTELTICLVVTIILFFINIKLLIFPVNYIFARFLISNLAQSLHVINIKINNWLSFNQEIIFIKTTKITLTNINNYSIDLFGFTLIHNNFINNSLSTQIINKQLLF